MLILIRRLKFLTYFIFLNLADAVESKPMLTTSLSIYSQIVLELTQNQVEVSQIIPTGSNLHDFEPSQAIIKMINKSKFIILNGGGLDNWIIKYASRKKIKTLILAENLNIKNYIKNGDPHFWNNPKVLNAIIDVIATELAQQQPELKNIIIEQSQILKNKFIALDKKYSRLFTHLNTKQRFFVTTHQSAQYLSQEYGLTSLSPLGTQHDHELSAQKLDQLGREILDKKIKYIFIEENLNQIIIKKFAKKYHLELGPQLYLDGMPMHKKFNSVIELVEYNLETIYMTLKK